MACLFLAFLAFAGTWSTYDIYFYELYKLDNLNKEIGAYSSQKQYEIALLYIGSSTCGFCNVEELPPAFGEIKQILKKRAAEYGFGFKIIGIAKDDIITEGLVHLAKFGGFDEVMTGNGWSNAGILRYVYGELPGIDATPQILVTRRQFRSITNGDITYYQGLNNEILLIRKVGVDEIISWAKNNAYLPEGSFGFGNAVPK